MDTEPDILLPLHAYCDGSGTHHPDSPACIGVVIADDAGRILCESSDFVRLGTNNVAEILAIRRALRLVELVGPLGDKTPARVYSDSEYAIGFVTGRYGNYSGSKNLDLVAAMRKQYARHRGYALIEHVAGHAGIVGNELADWLAWRARRDHLGGQVARPNRRRPSDDVVLARPAPRGRRAGDPEKKSRREPLTHWITIPAK